MDGPKDGAQDSKGFRDSVLGEANCEVKCSLVSNSNEGEFVYHDRPRKLLFRSPLTSLHRSLGPPTVGKLCNPAAAESEASNPVEQRSEIVMELRKAFDEISTWGASHASISLADDSYENYGTTSSIR